MRPSGELKYWQDTWWDKGNNVHLSERVLFCICCIMFLKILYSRDTIQNVYGWNNVV